MPRFEEYVEYVDTHIGLVKEAWEFLKKQKGFPYVSDKVFLKIEDSLILNHDNSKFSDDELAPYASKFFPDEGEELSEGAFEEAVQKHYDRNPHHWQFWLDNDGVMVVTPRVRHLFLVEMVCDWMAMAKQNGNSVNEWFYKKIDSIKMDPHSFVFVQLLISCIEPKNRPWYEEVL